MFASVFKSTIILSVVTSLTTMGAATSSNNGGCDNGSIKCCNQMINVRPTISLMLTLILTILTRRTGIFFSQIA